MPSIRKRFTLEWEWGTVGGRATSGLQGKYGQVGSAPDRLGGLDLIAGRRQHSGQSGSVCTYVPALCCGEKKGIREKTDQRDPERTQEIL